MLLVTRIEDEKYSLRVVVPVNHDKEAFSWAINHLKFQYAIADEPSYTTWPSTVGAQILVAEGLLQALSESSTTVSNEDRETFVAATLKTLRSLRDAAVRTHSSSVDELCTEDRKLGSDFSNLFASILPQGMLKTSSTRTPWYQGTDEQTNAHWKRQAPSPKVKRKRNQQAWTSDHWRGKWNDEYEWHGGAIAYNSTHGLT